MTSNIATVESKALAALREAMADGYALALPTAQGSIARIQFRSDAWSHLRRALDDDLVYRVRVDLRDGGQVAVKCNEWAWSHNLTADNGYTFGSHVAGVFLGGIQ